jgi:amidase
VAADIKTALADLAAELARSGCRVERCDPAGFDYARALQVYGLLKEAALTVRSSPMHLPRSLWRAAAGLVAGSNPIGRGLLQGAGTGLKSYAMALSQRDGYIAKMEQFLTEWDVWLVPVAALPAYPHLQSRNPVEQLRATVEVDGLKIPYLLATSMYTAIFNLTGNPVVVLPLGQSREGLPFGMQVVGRRWNDMALLAIAEQLTRFTGLFQAPPEI